jgi:hypothetical protein
MTDHPKSKKADEKKSFILKSDVDHLIDLIKYYAYENGEVSNYIVHPPTLTGPKIYVTIGLFLPIIMKHEPITVNSVITFSFIELSQNLTRVEGWYKINYPTKGYKIDWKPVIDLYHQIYNRLLEDVGEIHQRPATDAPLSEWFDYMHSGTESLNLKAIANLTCKSYSYIRREHAKYKHENGI